MLYNLHFKLENNKIPIQYREVFISYFKNILTTFDDGKFYNEYYGNSKKKNICWSVFLKNPKFEKDFIKVENNEINMNLKLSDLKTSFVFLNSLLKYKNKEFPIKDNYIILDKLEKKLEKSIDGNVCELKLLSPLCVRKHNKETNKDYYYSIKDENFNHFLLENIKNNINENFKDYVDDLKMDTSRLKKTVIKIFGLSIECSIGSIIFMGNKNLLNEIYNSGIGSRKSEGFGLLKIIDFWNIR